jgi:hypothetical protein
VIWFTIVSNKGIPTISVSMPLSFILITGIIVAFIVDLVVARVDASRYSYTTTKEPRFGSYLRCVISCTKCTYPLLIQLV